MVGECFLSFVTLKPYDGSSICDRRSNADLQLANVKRVIAAIFPDVKTK
jgi:hypothetical protein